MTSLNDLFKELGEIKKQSKQAHKEKVEKYNLIESPDELNVRNEIEDIFSQLNTYKQKVEEQREFVKEQKEKESKILTGLEKVLTEKIDEKIEDNNELIESVENEEEPLEKIEEDKEEIQEPQEEIEKTIQPIDAYSKFITKEEEKKEKQVIKEETQIDALSREIDKLKKRISSLATQIATAPTKFPEGNSGGELNLNKPEHVTSEHFYILGAGGNDLFLCNTLNNDISVYLPEASKNTGFKVHVKKMHRNNQLYIRGYNSSELIDEKVVQTINTQYVTLQIVCDGHNWYIV